MKTRTVVLTPEALRDMESIYSFVAEAAGPPVAGQYLARIRAYLEGLSRGAQRGTLRDDIRPGVRTVGFERRLTIMFQVRDDSVAVLRVFGRGVNWEQTGANGPPE